MECNVIADALLSRLAHVRETGPMSWSARCPAHEDRNPSLSVTELAGDKVLVNCHAGCSTIAVVAEVGLSMSDLFAPRETGVKASHRKPRPFMPSDVFNLTRNEAGVVWVIGADMRKSKTISDDDFERLTEAVRRLDNIAKVAYGCR